MTRQSDGDKPPVSAPFKAKFRGRCAVCGGLFSKGISVVWLTGSGPAHEQCAPVYPDGERS